MPWHPNNLREIAKREYDIASLFADCDKVEIKDFIEANILSSSQKIKLVGSDIDIKKQ